jgi:RNA recognition motif-containing protein
MNIFVAKLDYGTTSEELQTLFEGYGEVSSAKVIMDRETGRSKGFGFVEMPDDDAAQEAISNLNDSEVHGRTIVVKKAEPRENNRGGFNRGGGGGGYNRGGGGGGYNRGGGDYNRY